MGLYASIEALKCDLAHFSVSGEPTVDSAAALDWTAERIIKEIRKRWLRAGQHGTAPRFLPRSGSLQSVI